jgi:membrane protein DedA with SNARE-associated domain
MDETLAFLASWGYAALFAIVFADQAGLPFPGEVFLVATGALCARGDLGLVPALGAAVLASLAADLLWYEIGRRRGAKVLGFLCRLSLEPDSCVRSTETLFERRGPAILVVAKFVPGLSTVAPPLAGMLGTGVARFLLLDLVGCLLWVGTFLALGVLFGDQIGWVTGFLTGMGAPLALLALGVVASYVGWKYVARWRFLRRLRIARVSPDDVHRRIEAGEDLFIVDLRNELDHATDPRRIPGARRIPAEELAAHHDGIPRDRDVILYCT